MHTGSPVDKATVLASLFLTASVWAGTPPASAQTACETPTLSPRDFSPGAVPRNTKRQFTSLNGGNAVDLGGTTNRATLNSHFSFASTVTVTMHPWHIYPIVFYPPLLSHIIVKIDMDNNGSWDVTKSIPLSDYDGTVTASRAYPEPTYPNSGSRVIRWQIEEWRRTPNGSPYLNQTTSGTTEPIVTLATPNASYASPEGDAFTGYVSPDGVWDRPLLVVEGLDEGADGANRTFPDDYFGRLMDRLNGSDPSVIDALLTGGYDVFVYNYDDAGVSMRCNAMGVLGAIQTIGDIFAPNPYPTRVLGISMGGVVGRYALAWAEDQGIDHRCDMFISADAPQQGAYVNYPFQDWVHDLEATGGNPTIAQMARPIKTDAAKQLLVANRWDPFVPKGEAGKTGPIEGGPMYEAFYNELNALNPDPTTSQSGYPHRTTNIGISNGRGDIPGHFIPSAYPEVLEGQRLAQLSVEGIELKEVTFELRDLEGGSYQPAFAPRTINQTYRVFNGFSILGLQLVDPVDLKLTVTLGPHGPPTFIQAFSALDLWDLDWNDGNDRADITNWGSSKFDHIYMVPLIDPITGLETKTAYHDEFPQLVVTPVVNWLLAGPQRSRVVGTVSDGASPLAGIRVQAVNANGTTEQLTITDAAGNYHLDVTDVWAGSIQVSDPYWNVSTPPSFPVGGGGTPATHIANFAMSHATTTFGQDLLVDNAAPSYRDVQLYFEGNTVFCAWTQGTGQDDFAWQKLSSTGGIQWQGAKLLAGNPGFAETNGHLVSDWSWGGTYAWRDYRLGAASPGQIYLANADIWGNPRWGERLVTSLSDPGAGAMAPVFALIGSFVFWTDNRGAGTKVYGQMIDDLDGSAPPGWPAQNGIVMSSSPVHSQELDADYDDGNGAVVAWVDAGTGAVWLNKVAPNASRPWGSAGVRAATVPGAQSDPAIYGSAGGAWVCFTVLDPVSGHDIQLQHIGTNGAPEAGWPSQGVRICAATGDQQHAQILSVGGMCVVWEDSRGGPYAQLVGSYGELLWPANGVDVTNGLGAPTGEFQAVIGSQGDLFVGWGGPSGEYRVQRVDISSGATLWGQGAVLAASHAGKPVLYRDYNADGVFVAWTNDNAELRMTYMETDFLAILGKQVFIQSQSCGAHTISVRANWTTTSDASVSDTFELVSPSGQSHVLTQSGPAGTSHSMLQTVACEPGTWSYKLKSFDSAENQTSTTGSFYATCPPCPRCGCRPQGKTLAADVLIESTPAAPLSVTREFSFEKDADVEGAAVVLANVSDGQPMLTVVAQDNGEWTTLHSVTLGQQHRGPALETQTEGVTPGVWTVKWEGTHLHAGTTLRVTVTLPPSEPLHAPPSIGAVRVDSPTATYLGAAGAGELTALDVQMSAELLLQTTDGPPVRTVFLDAAPNPFNPSTTIRFGVPSKARVTLCLYSVSGRLVSRLVAGELAAGVHQLQWNGDDLSGHRVASGVYFARLDVGETTLLKKLILVK